jgi:hypothetical protein
MIRLLAHPPSSLPLSVNKLSLFLSLHVCPRSILMTGEGGGDGRIESLGCLALYNSVLSALLHLSIKIHSLELPKYFFFNLELSI